MKDFEEMIQKVLKERQEKLEKVIRESAENIIEKAIEHFGDIGVESVYIEIDSKREDSMLIYSEKNKNKMDGRIYVPYREKVLNIVEEILSSEDSKISQYFHISKDSTKILIQKKDNVWTKKEEYSSFFVCIRKLNAKQIFYFFIKKYWQNKKINIK